MPVPTNTDSLYNSSQSFHLHVHYTASSSVLSLSLIFDSEAFTIVIFLWALIFQACYLLFLVLFSFLKKIKNNEMQGECTLWSDSVYVTFSQSN